MLGVVHLDEIFDGMVRALFLAAGKRRRIWALRPPKDGVFVRRLARRPRPNSARLVHITSIMVALVLLLALFVAPEDAPKPAASSSSSSAPKKAVPAAPSKTIVGEIVWVDFPSRIVLVRESVKSTAVKGK